MSASFLFLVSSITWFRKINRAYYLTRINQILIYLCIFLRLRKSAYNKSITVCVVLAFRHIPYNMPFSKNINSLLCKNKNNFRYCFKVHLCNSHFIFLYLAKRFLYVTSFCFSYLFYIKKREKIVYLCTIFTVVNS